MKKDDLEKLNNAIFTKLDRIEDYPLIIVTVSVIDVISARIRKSLI